MNLKKIALLLVSTLTVATFTGCFGDDDSTGTDSDLSVSEITVEKSALDGAFDIAYTLKASGGIDSTVITSTFNGETEEPETDTDWNGETEFDVALDSIEFCNGDYTVKVTVYSEGKSASKSKEFTITEGTDCSETPIGDLDVKTYDLGANKASTGSSIDLDAGAVYTNATSVGKEDVIDLYYGHSDISGKDLVFTPAEAKGAGFTGPKAWDADKVNEDVIIVASDITAAEFAAMETQEDLLTEGSKLVDENDELVGTPLERLEVVEGTVFWVITEGEPGIFLVMVDAQTAGAAGTITIKTVMAED